MQRMPPRTDYVQCGGGSGIKGCMLYILDRPKEANDPPCRWMLLTAPDIHRQSGTPSSIHHSEVILY